MALKKPSDFFGNNKTPLDEVKESYDSARPEKIEKVSEAFDAFKSNLNHIQSLSDFTSTFDSFKNNLEKVESVSGEVSEIREEIKTLIKKEDLDSAMMAQLLFVEESITNIESKISSINGKTVDSIKEDFANLSDTINGFLSVDVPKYKKLIAESEVKTDSRFATFKEGIEENLDKIKVDVNKEVETALESIESINENTINIVKAEVKETVGDVNKKVNELVEKELPKYKKLFAETEVKTEEKINSAIHSYKSTIESLSERVKEFTEEEIPKYSNLLIETKLKSEKEVKKLEEEVLSRVKTLSEKVESLSEDVEQKTFERVESLQDVVKEYKEEIESISKRYETLQKDFTGRVVHEDKKLSQYSKKLDEFSKRFSFIEETLTEDVRELKENLETNTSKFYTELKSEIDNVEQNIAQTVKDLEVNIVINETHLKKQNEYIGNIQEEVKEVLDKLQLDVLEKKNAQLVERINHVEEVFSKINEKTLLTEDNPTLPGDPSTNNSGDPLTPIDQKFVTLDQLQNHYRIFINRIQQQIATIGGGGEVRLEFLDDVDRDSVKVDGKFLKYQASSGKFIGADASGDVGAGGTWATFDSNTGITTTKKVKINNDLEVTGVTTSTGGFVGTLTGSASSLSGLSSSFLLDYNNFTNTPTIPTNNNQLTNGAGFITASDNITGTAAGLSGSPDISIRNITGVAATFTGVLTYEDVTNIDSLGLGTFRSGLIVQGTGTTSTTLNVSGVSTFSGDISIADKIIHTGDTNTAIRFPAADTFTVETSGSERLRITSAGNVGIGTNNSLQKLHIVDDTSANIYLETKNSSTGSTSGIYFRTSDSSTQDAFFKTAIVLEDDGTSFARGKLHILQDNTADDSNATLSDSVVTIDQSGNVGIGTDDLQARLTVYSTASNNFLREIRIDASDAPSGSNGSALFKIITDGNSLGKYIIGYNSTHPSQANDVSLKNADGDISFHTAANDTPAEKLRITTTGRVGINQSSPAYTLDLGESASTIRLVSEDGGTAIRIGPGGDSNDITLIRVDGAGEAHDGESDSAKLGFSLKYLGSGSGNANAFAIFSDNQTGTQVQAFTVLQDGTVGINSTIPSERLDVGGTTKTEQLNVSGISTFSGDISIADKIIHTGDTNTAIRFPADDTFTIETAGSERLRIDSNGDVGVGIADPQERLHVARTVMVTGNTPQIRLNANDSDADDDDRTMLGQATSAGNFVTTAVDNDTILRGTTTGNLLFGVGTAEKLRIDSSGRLLIGTTTEGNELADNLTVADTGNCGITIRSGSSSYGSIYFSDATSGGGEYAGQIEYLHSVDRFTFYAGVSAIMRVHSDKIDVLGHTETDTLNVSGISTFANTVSVAETIEHTGDTNTSISFPSNDYIRLTTSGSSRLNATANGYILLGTNSEPSGGDAHAENARLLIQGRIGNTADSGRLNLQRGSSASNDSSIGSITFTDNSNNAYARIETQADATPGTDDYPGRIVFSTTPDGSASPTEKFRIADDGDITFSGPNNSFATISYLSNFTKLDLRGTDIGSSVHYLIGYGAGHGSANSFHMVNGTSTGNIAFRTGSSTSERLRITSSGNVGINSGIPSEVLDVGGTTQTQILKVNGSSTFNGNINMFSTAPQLIMKEDGSSHGDTNWALVRDADSFSIRWNNASPYAFRASTSGGSVTSVFLRQSGLEVNASGTVIQGSLSKGSGSFKIDHPLVGMSTTHNLVHSFIEGPQADLIYRGKVDLVNGSATVNIDTAGRMTEGTFVALCTNVQCFTTNETDWTAIKGSVSGNTLTVLAQDSSCTATVSWMVVGERKDQHMIDTNWTDDNGRVITEPPKTD